jgi:hypothetical protein
MDFAQKIAARFARLVAETRTYGSRMVMIRGRAVGDGFRSHVRMATGIRHRACELFEASASEKVER